MTTFNEIYAFNEDTTELFQKLAIEERVFVYYMFRAGLPFNKIFRNQNHVHTNEIISAFEFLYKHEKNILPELFNEIKLYLVYLWSNHGIYFMGEHSNSKRTPSRLNMQLLTESSFSATLKELKYEQPFEHLIPTIFDDNVDPEPVVDGSIENSGNNYYGKGLTNEHYNSFTPEQKNKINAYFELDKAGNPTMRQYSVNDKYSNELTVVIFWLGKAFSHSKNYPDTFDVHIPNSLLLLIEYFISGNEEKFKQHSIEWLQTKSNLDYTMGFVETYADPMKIRGQAGSDITVKLTNMEKMNKILSEIEQRVPIPKEYKKTENSNLVMNVSPNKILFSSGDYGPLIKIAAYCLPNYDDIRAEIGSKQILYKLPKSLAQTINPDMAKLFKTKNRLNFIENYDKDNEIMEDLWDVQVLLHEISHGSGRLHKHTFKFGENLTIGNITYNIGDTIPITDANYAEFIKEDSDSLEELRAEINALYMSITEIDVLSREGLFKNWLNVLGREELQKQCIIEMCDSIFGRLLSQGDNMTNIRGAHARANFVITNYLLEGKGICVNTEPKEIDGQNYTLLEIIVDDVNKATASTIELLQRVQRIKSTGDTLDCKLLFDTYIKYPITIEESRKYRQYMLDVRKKLVGNIKESVRIFPRFTPVLKDGNIVDVTNKVHENIFQQNLYQEELTMSFEYQEY